MKKKLVIFDLDGVLIDSRNNMEFAWGEVVKSIKTDVSFNQYFRLVGMPFSDILDELGLSDQADKIEEIFRTSSAEKISEVNFYPGVMDVLAKLKSKGLKLSIVTSKDKLRTDSILSRLPLIFDDVQTPNDFYRGKPAPDHLLLSMAVAQTDPLDSIYIGDMNVDFEASKRAGVDYLHANWGYGRKPFEFLPSIDSIEFLCNYLDLGQ